MMQIMKKTKSGRWFAKIISLLMLANGQHHVGLALNVAFLSWSLYPTASWIGVGWLRQPLAFCGGGSQNGPASHVVFVYAGHWRNIDRYTSLESGIWNLDSWGEPLAMYKWRRDFPWWKSCSERLKLEGFHVHTVGIENLFYGPCAEYHLLSWIFYFIVIMVVVVVVYVFALPFTLVCTSGIHSFIRIAGCLPSEKGISIHINSSLMLFDDSDFMFRF